MKKNNAQSDLSMKLTDFVIHNFNKKLLFSHSLHPTNILLYELFRYIMDKLNINIEEYEYEYKQQH